MKVHFTAFFLLPLIHQRNQSILFSLLIVLLILVSVTLHELGHTLVAQRYGIKVQDIVLSPIGGVARLLGLPENPHEEIRIALAGPYVSLFLFLSSYSLSLFCLRTQLVIGYIFFAAFASINLILFVFNLLPCFPMDGGRVLRAWLSLKKGALKATEIAAAIGKYIAIAFIALGLLYQQTTLAIIGVFVLMFAGSELRMMKLRSWQQNLTGESEPLETDFVASPPPYETSSGNALFKNLKGVPRDFIQTAVDLFEEVLKTFLNRND